MPLYPTNLPTTFLNDGKTQILQTGTLVTTATTADQVILTYTVSAGNTFCLTYLNVVGAQTTPSGGTSIVLGTLSLEAPSGTKVMIKRCLGGGGVLPDGLIFTFTEPLFFNSGTVIRAVVTPASTTSFTWSANFGGYER